jgi:hypothetical protein
MTDSYTNSKNKLVVITDMAYPHLRSALAKAEREVTGTTPEWRHREIAAMKADLERREEEHARAQQENGDA